MKFDIISITKGVSPCHLSTFRAIAGNSRITDDTRIGSQSIPNANKTGTIWRLKQIEGARIDNTETLQAKRDLINAIKQEYGESIATKIENDSNLLNLKSKTTPLTKRIITQVFTVVDRELKAAFNQAVNGAKAANNPTPASTVLNSLEAWARDVKNTTGEGTAMLSSEINDPNRPGSQYSSTDVKTFFFRGEIFNNGCKAMRKTVFDCVERQLNDLGYSLIGKEGKMKPPSQIVNAFKLDDFKLDSHGVPQSDRPMTARRVLAITEALHELRASAMTLQRNGDAFDVPAHVFIGSLKAARALPENAGKSIDEVAQIVKNKIQERMDNGLSVINKVKNNNYKAANQQQYKQDIADATLYLQLRARQLGEAFDRGAMSIEDPGDKLFNFFHGQQDTLRRKSTHLTQIRGKGLPGIDEKHFGNGFVRNDYKHGLPGGMGAIVFGKIPPLKNGNNQNQTNRLWLKTETYHVTGGADAESANHLARLFTKEKDGIKHGEELKGLTNGNGVHFDLMGDFKATVKQVSEIDTSEFGPTHKSAHKACLKILTDGIEYSDSPKNKPVAEKESVRSVYMRLNAAMAKLVKGTNLSKTTYEKSVATDSAYNILLAFRNKIDGALGMRHGDIENRIGDEVLLQNQDI